MRRYASLMPRGDVSGHCRKPDITTPLRYVAKPLRPLTVINNATESYGNRQCCHGHQPVTESFPIKQSALRGTGRLSSLLLVILVTLLFTHTGQVAGVGGASQGPRFTHPPPKNIHFTNTSGATVDCTASGSPLPTVTWASADGTVVQEVPGLREILQNGSLVFPPFPAHLYDTNLHTATYTCQASSPAGTLLALPTQVRAVVVGGYEVQVYDQLVMSGNTAVLRCAIPPFVREYVSVTSWVHDNTFNIYPSLHGDGKYYMTPGGDLHVLEVGPQDGLSRYQCRTLHTLTSRTQLSRTPARIIITEAQGSVPPRMSERAGRVVAQSGSRVTLPCVAQGHPPPHYIWYKGSTPLTPGSDLSIVGGSLVLGDVGVADGGEYTCVANNSAGETRFSAHLLVTTPLSVQVTPSEVQVDAGGRLELRCHVSGQPVDTVNWYKDGAVLRSGGRLRMRPRESLHIAPVDPSDAGIYQCGATYHDDQAMDQAYVSLGAAAPQLVYRFIEQTLQPGPAVSLKCIATGSPTPHITWTLDGFPLPHSHRYLKGQYVSAHGDVISHVNISSVHVTDGGTYTCTAENAAGQVVHSARLNVYGPPHVRAMGQVSAVAGETFVVTCPASGFPLSKIVWKKDGVRLPTSHRQRVHSNGTLVVDQVTRGVDEGRYSCTAVARQDRSDTQHLTLRVMVAPVLLPFHFEERLQEGDRVGAACIVSKGDPPITFTWEKDGQPIKNTPGVTVSSSNDFSSTLMISGLSAHHSGRYTCSAVNDWSRASHSASLGVNVPPAWVVEPSSASVALSGSVALHCLAKGFPNPTIIWRKESASGEFVTVAVGEGGVAGWENGTLSVSRAERRHEGRYLCEASNDVGTGLSKVVVLSVNEPPWFSVRSQRQEVMVEEKATLSCEAHGDTPLRMGWTRDGGQLPANPRYQVSERDTDTGQVSELVIRSSHLEDSGSYECTASNTHGSLTADYHLLVQDVPGPPTGLGVVEEGSRHLTFSWTAPVDSNAPISSYVVSFRTKEEPHVEKSSSLFNEPREIMVEGEQLSVRLEDLLPSTSYVITVVAENRVGRGQVSSPLRITTQEEPPSGPPQNVRAVPMSSSSLQVSWEPPLQNLTHGTILGYYLGFKDDSESEGGAYNFTTVGVDGAGITSATLAGLRPHARYSVILQAFNSQGAGPASPPALGTTLEDKPSAPPSHVTCETVTSNSLVVTWTPPPPRQSNGIITNYRVSYTQANNHRESTSGSIVSEVLRTTLVGLLPWTNYSLTVTASTRAGEGIPSLPLVCTTDQDVPEAPARVKAVASGPRTAVISWAPPENPHGRVTRYTVHWALTGGRGTPHSRRVNAHRTHFTLSDLPHSSHQVWVTAWTRVGEGPPSKVAVLNPSHSVPAGVWSVGGNLTVAWKEDVSLPCGSVGDPEPVLTWTHNKMPISPDNYRLTVQPDGTLTVTDIQRADSGRYTCTAKNRHGSDSVTYNLTVLVPPSAPSLHVTETTASSIRVQWSLEDTGDAPLQGATLHYRSAGGGGEWLTAESDGTTRILTVRGLRCGTLHHFYLTARNHIGTSAASATVEARTKGRPPESPPQFQFVTTNSTQATLYLTQWGDGGCPITHFSVHYRREGKHHLTTVGSEIPPSRTFAVGGLEGGRLYHLKVTAHNSAGATPAHYTITTAGREDKSADLSAGNLSEGVWGPSSSTLGLWRDARVVLPALVSTVALFLTITTVCVCLKKKRPPSAPQQQKEEAQDAVRSRPSEIVEEKNILQTQEDIYTTVRRPPATPPPPQLTSDFRDTNGDYSEEDLYPYATATFQLGGGSPPPPAPPSPPSHAQHRPRGQKAFTAVVFQPPSLHDVDSPNIGSETDDYGSSTEAHRAPPLHRRPRHLPRNSRVARNVHFP